MSNTETAPTELKCGGRSEPADGRPAVEILAPRDVPLGGPRAMHVRRTLPQRARSLIGAWCFADHYGPTEVAGAGGMDVAPHPHTGLQTVSWLFEGEIDHRDSMGTHALVRPGELNLMTGGHGICHSEVSTPAATKLHGVQLWVALPEAHRHTARDFHHYVPPAAEVGGATLRVFLGSLAGRTSPIPTFSPLLGAELVLSPDTRMTLGVDPAFEHGILVDTGDVAVAGTRVGQAELGYLRPGTSSLELVTPSNAPARLLLLGGTPFDEEILMWWNFVGRTHEEIVEYRGAWQAESDQFGQVEGYAGTPSRLPAPELPAVRIKPRANPPR